MAKIITKKGVSFLTFSIFENENVTVAVSTRQGGVSTGNFASLNMGFPTGDDGDNVRENRRRFFDALGSDYLKSVNGKQVHGIRMARASRLDCGRGALSFDTAIDDCDGLYTDEPDVPLAMSFADCTPLLFYDPVTHSIAAAHGGWRGSAGNIVSVAIGHLKDSFGSKPENIKAAIGPAIGFCHFEVGTEVIEAFQSLFTKEEMEALSKSRGNGKYLFDLPEANRLLMIREGILPQHIEDCRICTCDRDDLFYSYRKAGGVTGRHMAVMILR